MIKFSDKKGVWKEKRMVEVDMSIFLSSYTEEEFMEELEKSRKSPKTPLEKSKLGTLNYIKKIS